MMPNKQRILWCRCNFLSRNTRGCCDWVEPHSSLTTNDFAHFITLSGCCFAIFVVFRCLPPLSLSHTHIFLQTQIFRFSVVVASKHCKRSAGVYSKLANSFLNLPWEHNNSTDTKSIRLTEHERVWLRVRGHMSVWLRNFLYRDSLDWRKNVKRKGSVLTSTGSHREEVKATLGFIFSHSHKQAAAVHTGLGLVLLLYLMLHVANCRVGPIIWSWNEKKNTIKML